MGNPTVFNVLVPDRASVWRVLAALARIELLDPRGVPMEDITDLFDTVRFCRHHDEHVEVPVQSSGRCSQAVLATLFERIAEICDRLEPQELLDDLATIQDFSVLFSYRTKDSLSEAMVSALRPIAASVFARRYVTRVAIDPDNSEVSYTGEVELIDPFDLKDCSTRFTKWVGKHLDNPDAYVNDRARVERFIKSDESDAAPKHITLTLSYEAGFIIQYALRTMEVLSRAVPQAGIFGGTPDDAALPAAIPLSENNLYTFRFKSTDGGTSCERALDFLDVVLTGGLLGDSDAPLEEIETGQAVNLRLANGGHELLQLKDGLAPGADVAQMIDETVLSHGNIDARTYRQLCRGILLGGLSISRLWLATHAAVALRDPSATSATGATLVRALEAYSAFRAQVFHDFPDRRETLQEIFESASSKPAHVSIDRDPSTGEGSVMVDVHWSFAGYFGIALEQLARDRGFNLRNPDEANSYLVE